MPFLPRHRLPAAPKGARIGLFGGSFDPAHDGHVHVTRAALRALRLDQVWWLVTPGNPLKPDAPAALDRRMQRARAIMRHPKVQVTDLESQLGTRYTADTLARLQALYPDRHFVWIMGGDNLAGLHHWENWNRIICSIPMAVIARPGARAKALRAVAARVHAAARVPERAAAALAMLPPPAWCFLTVPLRAISSTQMRQAGEWRRKPDM
jgi:nicotinate-nucleotide adenylyltransferase